VTEELEFFDELPGVSSDPPPVASISRIPATRTTNVGPNTDTLYITCPACSARLPVEPNATQATINATKSAHRKQRPSCDAILKRRAKVW
jgi:hypothetical protein